MSEVETVLIDGVEKKNKKNEILSWVWIITAVMGFRSIFFEPFKIPSGSMIPTLLIGDYILVNKFSYGLKIPFSHALSEAPIYITEQKLPLRGDVIVFKYPLEQSLNYIKRVVGLPGDTIQVVNKMLYINDVLVAGEVIDGQKIMSDMDEKFKYNSFIFSKTKIESHQFVTQIDRDNANNSDFPRTKIPKDMVFVMGDNRDYSADSRVWGFVPKGLIKGKAVGIWFSMNIPWFWENTGPFTFRPWRIFKKIN